jgi:hypothetical protein
MKPRYKDQEKGVALREENSDRSEWLGYANKEEEQVAQARHREEKRRQGQKAGLKIEDIRNNYKDGELQNYFTNQD